jgi:hypothetical protein
MPSHKLRTTAYGLAVASHRQFCVDWRRVSAEDPALEAIRHSLIAWGLRELARLRSDDQQRSLESERNAIARPQVWGDSTSEMLERFRTLAAAYGREAIRLQDEAARLDPSLPAEWIELPAAARPAALRFSALGV